MKLNSKQIDHLLNRIQSIGNAKRATQIKALGELVKNPEGAMTSGEKYAQIASGKAALKPFEQCKRYHGFKNLDECFTFAISPLERAKFKEYEDAVERINNAVKATSQEIIDKLMLSGDADEALKLLQEFEKSST